MQFLNYFNFKTLKYDLFNKFIYGSTKDLPKVEKIILNFGCKTTEIKRLSASLLALELVTQQKGKLTKAKNSNILLKLRKGNPVGCKVTLRNKQMFRFLERLLVDIFPKIKNFTGLTISKKIKQNIFTYELHDTLSFTELEENYYLFNNLPKLSITIVTRSQRKEELIFILKSLQVPIKNSTS